MTKKTKIMDAVLFLLLYLYFSAGNSKGCLQISQVQIMDAVVLLQTVILAQVYLSDTIFN